MKEPGFPRSLHEFYRRYPDEPACIAFVTASRWPEGVRCPRCAGSRTSPVVRRPCSWRCPACAYVFSAISGTVMENTKLPLATRHGRKGRELFGGKAGKFVVLGAIEVRPTGRPARLRLRHVENLRAPTLLRFVEDCVEPGSTVTTDGNPSYEGVTRLGMTHRVQSTAFGDPQDAVLRYLHLAFSNLKTWYAGTYHGRVEAKHLQGYLNEFCFRFNRRDDLFLAFRTVLGIAGRVPGPTRRALYTTGPGRYVHPNPHEPEEPYG